MTDIARLDELAVGTSNYSRWKATLERKGFVIEETRLDGNLSAYIDDVVAQEGKIISGRVFVDPQKFAYLDMLHESRHIGQLMRLAKQGLTNYAKGQFTITGFPKTRGILQWLERGAWEYELRIGHHFGFSAEYMQFAWNQAYKTYWHHGFVTEFNQPKGSMGKYLMEKRNQIDMISG